jgi:hypothetical protein
MDISKHCIHVIKFHLFKEYFYTSDIYDNGSLFIKTAKDNNINISEYNVIERALIQTGKYSYTFQRLIFSIRKKDVDKLPYLIEKFHNNMMLKGYIDFEDFSEKDISSMKTYSVENSQ